ncbi:hypothetical protein JW906_02305 [bacterium]|nr:hypothetical protein [bacterium]
MESSPLPILKRAPGVVFDPFLILSMKSITAVYRMIHERGAVSPIPVGPVSMSWTLHQKEEDHPRVLHGSRHAEGDTPDHGRIVSFDVSPDRLFKNGYPCHEGPAMLMWPGKVFHRIHTHPVYGSASLNFAARYPGFDIKTHFNICDLNAETVSFKVIREGRLDQPDNVNNG